MWSLKRSSGRNSEKCSSKFLAAQPCSPPKPRLKVDDSTSGLFLLLLRLIKCECQRLTYSGITCTLITCHIKSYRAHSYRSVGKETLCILKDLIPLTHEYKRKWLILEGRNTCA